MALIRTKLGYIRVMVDSAMRTKTTTKSERAVRPITELPTLSGLLGVYEVKQTCKGVFLDTRYTYRAVTH